MCPLFNSLFEVVDTLLSLLYLLLIITAILSWLFAFNIVNRYQHRGVAMVDDMLARLTEPLLRPIRRVVPLFNGIDLSFLILVLLVIFVQSVLRGYFGNAVCY